MTHGIARTVLVAIAVLKIVAYIRLLLAVLNSTSSLG